MKGKTFAPVGLVLLASVLVAMLLAYTTKWYLAIFGLIPLVSGLLGVLMLILALIAFAVARLRRSPGLRSRGNILLLAGVFFLLQLVYLPLARSFRDREVSRAQEFIQMLIPRLEAYRDQHDAPFPIYCDSYLLYTQQYDIVAFPTLVGINEAGQVALVWHGYRDAFTLDDYVRVIGEFK